MPYAQQHYPFENKEKFHATFPADFVSEGIDQTRGWFYTMLVVSTLLFDTAPWKNLIVSGLVLAASVHFEPLREGKKSRILLYRDGKKMSKSLKNYPDPSLIVNQYGADAMRFVVSLALS
jgi:isoleucyl-tRNA synthetase